MKSRTEPVVPFIPPFASFLSPFPSLLRSSCRLPETDDIMAVDGNCSDKRVLISGDIGPYRRVSVSSSFLVAQSGWDEEGCLNVGITPRENARPPVREISLGRTRNFARPLLRARDQNFPEVA